MACHLFSDKPLSEPIMFFFNEIIITVILCFTRCWYIIRWESVSLWCPLIKYLSGFFCFWRVFLCFSFLCFSILSSLHSCVFFSVVCVLCFTPCIYIVYCKGRIVIADSVLMTLYNTILSITMMLFICTCVGKIIVIFTIIITRIIINIFWHESLGIYIYIYVC